MERLQVINQPAPAGLDYTIPLLKVDNATDRAQTLNDVQEGEEVNAIDEMVAEDPPAVVEDAIDKVVIEKDLKAKVDSVLNRLTHQASEQALEHVVSEEVELQPDLAEMEFEDDDDDDDDELESDAVTPSDLALDNKVLEETTETVVIEEVIEYEETVVNASDVSPHRSTAGRWLQWRHLHTLANWRVFTGPRPRLRVSPAVSSALCCSLAALESLQVTCYFARLLLQ